MNIREVIYGEFDKIMDAGWRSFVDRIREENRKSNQRLFRLLTIINGARFVDDLESVMEVVNKYACLRVRRKPSGIEVGDKRWKSFPRIWINQKSNERGTMSGSMFVKAKENRWIEIGYSTD